MRVQCVCSEGRGERGRLEEREGDPCTSTISKSAFTRIGLDQSEMEAFGVCFVLFCFTLYIIKLTKSKTDRIALSLQLYCV